MEQGSRANFGRAVAVHRGTFGAGGWLWYIGGILVAAGIVGPIRAVVAPTPQQVKEGLMSAVITGAIALAIGLVVLIAPLLRWRQQVQLFENGFVWTWLLGVKMVGRDEVRGVTLITHRGRMGTYQEIAVTHPNGGELSISGLENAEHLANVLSGFARYQTAPAQVAWSPPGR